MTADGARLEPGAMRRLLPHAVLGLLALLGASAFVGFEGYFFSDEGAVLGQLELLDEGAWTTPRPFPSVDVGGDFVPMINAHVTADGWAPAAKHPVHIGLLHGAQVALGDVGPRLMGSVSVWLTACFTAVIGARRSTATGIAAFWLLAIASPLLFDAQLLIAHAPAAAVSAALFLLLDRRGRGVAIVAGAVLLVLLGALLRNEFLLLGAAVCAVLVAQALRRRDVWSAITGTAVGATVVLAHRIQPGLVELVAGGEARRSGLPSTSGTRDGPDAVLEGARRSLLDLGEGVATDGAKTRLALAVIFIGAGVLLACFSRVDRGFVTVVLGAGAVLAVVHMTDPHLVRGLVWAFPALVLLVPALWIGRERLDLRLLEMLAVAGAFGVLVIITQYTGGGGPEWGWRYFAIALPAVVPALAIGLTTLVGSRLAVHRPAIAFLAAALAAVSVGGLVEQRRHIERSVEFLDRVEDVVADVDPDHIVSADTSFGRFAYPVAITGETARMAGPEADRLLGLVRSTGSDRVLFVWREPEALSSFDLAPFEASEKRFGLPGGYRASVLEPNTRSPS